MSTTFRAGWAALRRALAPAIAAVLLFGLGRDRTPKLLLLAAFLVLAGGLLAPRAAGALDRGVARAAERLADALFTFLASVAWLVVLLPTWALSRLVGHSPLDDGWATDRSAWIGIQDTRRRTADGHPAHATRMGARAGDVAPRVRRRARLRLVAPAAAVALVAAALALRGDEVPVPSADIIDLRVGPPGPGDIDDEDLEWNGLPIDGYAHEGEPWIEGYFRELIASEPYHDYILGLRLRDVDGEHLTIVDGRRVTYSPDDAEVTVWFFGGSTMFGVGQRDDHTIPSVVARVAEDDGIAVRALNFGGSADASWGETIRFAEALESDLPRPDLVVFYDGANERGLASYRADDGSLDPSVMERYPLSDEDREAHRDSLGREPLPYGSERAEVEIDLAAAQYRRAAAVARRLAEPDDIPVVHAWQPEPFSKRPTPQDDELWRRTDFQIGDLPESTRIYAEMRRRSGVDPIDLSRALDDVDAPVYFDSSHTNELGARIIGTELYERLAPQLRDLATG